jgi:hypothetical protein
MKTYFDIGYIQVMVEAVTKGGQQERLTAK